jgi:hypothetical protein
VGNSELNAFVLDYSKEHSYVIRAYDNRVRQTSRSPYLYHNWSKIKDDTKHVVKWTEDNNGENDDNTIEFRDKNYMRQSTLFRSDGKCGKVEVIAVPFVAGSHACSNVHEALCLTRFLKEMHTEGFVHGDIRALNIVFAGDKTMLIDYDFGGIDGQVEYPPGYEKVLPDGGRGSANPGETITSERDIEALCYVLGGLHSPSTMAPHSSYIDWNRMKLSIRPLGEIEKSLSGMGNWTLELCFNFRIFLTEHDKPVKENADAVTPNKAVVAPPTKRVREA